MAGHRESFKEGIRWACFIFGAILFIWGTSLAYRDAIPLPVKVTHGKKAPARCEGSIEGVPVNAVQVAGVILMAMSLLIPLGMRYVEIKAEQRANKK